ncbi:HlyD family type I secretion periplasmic adaptor subunit [Acidisoma cellulosilytica]|uniref:Membrane fusion protein (MFP) family protein n=1 Tax=Acidisoma cellulosilyticum TaxID=2802395 RepID=A0A963YXJ8_9PROT|nr:HlyD family type I secretion periplasmic adaptor subunit [Acidisoma cellulosilyticum]MCB8878976.1 HlyD family type I secretion periplasmic adaptor subunit [Acidisoma cellulosilyticum]
MARQLLSSHKATDPQGDALAVLEFQSPTSALIATPVPRSARSVSLWVGVAVIASIVAASVIKIDKVVTGQGKLVSTEPTTLIQPLDTSIVRAIYVQQGQRVTKGQLLAELDPTFAAANLKADQEQVDSYTAQVERIQAQLAGNPYVPSVSNPNTALQLETYNQLQAQYTAGVANFDQQIASLKAQLNQSESDIRQYAQRLELANNVEAMRQQLQKMQVGSRLDSLAAADSRISMAGNLADAQASANKAIGDIASIQAQRDTYIQQWNANLSQQIQQAQNLLAPAQQSLTKDLRMHQLIMIKAPNDAIVLNLGQTSVGSVLQAGQQFISLTPLGTPLEADIVLSGQDTGYVNAGDKVDVKLDSLPFLQYGKLTGVVQYVSSDSFNPEQVQSGAVKDVTGSLPQGLFYMARVKILQNDLHNTPPGFELAPGMPLAADVKIGKRTVTEYMMKRVLPAFTDGMREPD